MPNNIEGRKETEQNDMQQNMIYFMAYLVEFTWTIFHTFIIIDSLVFHLRVQLNWLRTVCGKHFFIFIISIDFFFFVSFFQRFFFLFLSWIYSHFFFLLPLWILFLKLCTWIVRFFFSIWFPCWLNVSTLHHALVGAGMTNGNVVDSMEFNGKMTEKLESGLLLKKKQIKITEKKTFFFFQFIQNLSIKSSVIWVCMWLVGNI